MEPSPRNSMKNVYGYIRVSTTKQGKGVSLDAQRESIAQFAEREGSSIVEWFEEKETAAKRGRPVFMQLLKLLKAGKADGVILHKIDRGARNLKDWADLGELIDRGIKVHFAHESLDLNARGGRLSADIQAVIAADYVRNLREETKKGLYGRLKQGIYPFRAPIGYLDQGAGNPKKIDPHKGPLVRKIFKLYGTGRHSLNSLRKVAQKIGLTNTAGGTISVNGLWTILSNPFYCGIIRVKGETFTGTHQPIISVALFKKVQEIKSGSSGRKIQEHNFLFRKVLRCALCHYTLVGEKQKGKVYYRCHRPNCPTTSIRHDILERQLLQYLEAMELYAVERETLDSHVQWDLQNEEKKKRELANAISMAITQIEGRLERLADALLDGAFSKEAFMRKKEELLLNQRKLEQKKALIESKQFSISEQMRKFLELTKSPKTLYEKGNFEEKRRLVAEVFSNLSVMRKSLVFSMQSPYYELCNLRAFPDGDPTKERVRKMYPLLANMANIVIVYPNTTVVPRRKLSKRELELLYERLVEVFMSEEGDIKKPPD